MPALIIRVPKLVTAEFLFFMPDYEHILQTLVLQKKDFPPEYPVLTKFIDFWHRNLEGRLYRVRVAESDFYQSSYRFPEHVDGLIN